MGEGRGQGGFESFRSSGPSQGWKECGGAGVRGRLLEAMTRLPFSPPFPSVFASCMSEG